MNARHWLAGMGVGCAICLVSAAAEAREAAAVTSWSIQEASYTGEVVGGQSVSLTAELALQVLQDGLQEIPLSFHNAAITDLKVSGGAAHLAARGTQYALVVGKRGSCGFRSPSPAAAARTRSANC